MIHSERQTSPRCATVFLKVGNALSGGIGAVIAFGGLGTALWLGVPF
jgi:hypothetical protein